MLTSLPVLDFSQLDAGTEQAAEFRAELLRVTHEVGFFYLTGHGVDPALTAELLSVSREFFDLPDEQKLAVENIHSPQFRGYTRVGGELTANAVDWREQIDIGVDRAEVERTSGTPDYWRLEGPNLWPETLPELEAVAHRWNAELSRIALRLLRAWALPTGWRYFSAVNNTVVGLWYTIVTLLFWLYPLPLTNAAAAAARSLF